MILVILRFIFGIPGVILAFWIRAIVTFFRSIGLISAVAKMSYDTEEERKALPREDAHLYSVLNVAASIPEFFAPVIKKTRLLRLVLRYAGCILQGIWIAPIFRRPATFVNSCSLLPAAACDKYSTGVSFLRLSKEKQMLYKWINRFCNIPNAIGRGFKSLGIGIWGLIRKFGLGIWDIVLTFKNGSWSTRASFGLMGLGSIVKGQPLRGAMFMLFEIVFILYMLLTGAHWLSYLPSLGKQGPEKAYDYVFDTYTTVTHDNSFKILLYGVLTIFFIIAFIYTWRLNVKQNRILDQIRATGKKVKSGKDDLKSLVDDNFHATLLALPTLGILLFMVMPIFFMILVAFTNYDYMHDGLNNSLFTWVGFENFKALNLGELFREISWSAPTTAGSMQTFSATFGEILVWTLIWAFFATFTNYFLGMLVAMAINKKGIKFKKVWRTILVLTIAIPQFISLLYVSRMFSQTGIINSALKSLGLIKESLPFWDKPNWARVTVIIINIWIGIPYLMLITTGIPQDLYESSRIDGANGWQQYTKITLPYMLFVTGPYLLTSFTGNINNFNVIYLLTGGGPNMTDASAQAGAVGETDLLITWLFKLTTGAQPKYYLASIIGIMVFLVIAIISLIVYRVLPSVKNEEDFQ